LETAGFEISPALDSPFGRLSTSASKGRCSQTHRQPAEWTAAKNPLT
jgi:hypothetical protein